MNQEFKIDQGIPLPPPRVGQGVSAALRALKPGESFFIPEKHPADLSSFVSQTKLRGKVACRKVEEGGVVGTRVWRLPDEQPENGKGTISRCKPKNLGVR